jgi:acyl homoserine lactone synthase
VNNIITDHAQGNTFSPALIESMYQLRHDVFKGRLDWDVTSIDGQEKDEFDELNPVYMMSCNYRKQLEGCWRLLPTTGPYMLKDVFPQLLRGEEVPEDPNIWELSRLAVQPQMNHSRIKANLNEVTLDMFREVYDFAVANHITRYVVVTSAAIERMLRLVGIPTTRFGDGKLTRIGKVLSVCVWVDINDQFRQAVYGPIEHERKAA